MDCSSSNGSEKRRPRKARKMSKNKCIKEILKMQHQLLEDHKTPCLFLIRAKHGTVPSGSENLVEKFMKDNAKDETWEEAFDNDDEEIVDGTQMP